MTIVEQGEDGQSENASLLICFHSSISNISMRDLLHFRIHDCHRTTDICVDVSAYLVAAHLLPRNIINRVFRRHRTPYLCRYNPP